METNGVRVDSPRKLTLTPFVPKAADLLGVTARTINDDRAGGTIPRAMQIACRALAEDKTVFQAHYRPRRPGRPRLDKTA